MQDNKQPINIPAVPGNLVADIVKEIPVAMQDAKSQPANADDELEKIMRDVGHDIRQIGKKKPKHSWFSRSKKTKAEPKFSARPDQHLQPAPAALTVPLRPAHPVAPSQIAKPQAATIAAPAKTKQPKTAQKPIGAVLFAILVTTGLIAAAYFAYK